MLTKEEKVVFINEILGTLRGSLIQKVDEMPEERDGFEIRRLIADYAEEEIAYLDIGKSRLRDYENARIVRNI